MAKEENFINCSECGARIDVNKILYAQVQEQLQKKFENRDAKRKREFEHKQKEFEQEKNQLVKDKEDLNQQVEAAVREKLKTEKSNLEKKLRTEIEEETSDQLNELNNELKQKSEQVKELNKTKAEVSRLKREKSELKDQIQADAEKKFNEQLAKEKEQIKLVEQERTLSESQKKDKLIKDLSKRLEQAQTKLEQGSSKLAGEVKEIELRDYLKFAFPVDDIKDVPSGVRGADVSQVVRNNLGQNSGIILYERKQTQKFDDKWIPKLKEDGRTTKADICVIITKSMPKDNEETHFRNGVWVCRFTDLKILSTLLRDGLIKQYSALASQTDKGSKMEMLYNYLVSTDFQNHILGILEAFRNMDDSLEKEKEASLKKFGEREAHIFKAKQSILNFWGRVEGIGSDSLNKEMRMLERSVKELPTPE